MIISIVSVFYGGDDSGISMVLPHSELHILLVITGESLQFIDVEILAHYACHLSFRIHRIAFLFYMSRNQHARLAHIERLADTLESGGGGECLAASHHLEELLVVDAMEGERFIHLQFFRRVWLIPEEMKLGMGMLLVPRLYILGKAGIQHVAHDVVAMMADDGLGFLAEQRWNHLDAVHRLILIVTDGGANLAVAPMQVIRVKNFNKDSGTEYFPGIWKEGWRKRY